MSAVSAVVVLRARILGVLVFSARRIVFSRRHIRHPIEQVSLSASHSLNSHERTLWVAMAQGPARAWEAMNGPAAAW